MFVVLIVPALTATAPVKVFTADKLVVSVPLPFLVMDPALVRFCPMALLMMRSPVPVIVRVRAAVLEVRLKAEPEKMTPALLMLSVLLASDC